MTASAVYEGTIRHRRFEPVEHEFSYRLFLMYLDLEELPRLLDPFPLWSARRPAPAHFCREDYMGDPERPLAECVRGVLAIDERITARCVAERVPFTCTPVSSGCHASGAL